MDKYIIITIIVCSTALFGYVMRLLFASKCSNCDVCCLHIKRDTSRERKDISFKIPQFGIGNNNNNSPENNNNNSPDVICF